MEALLVRASSLNEKSELTSLLSLFDLLDTDELLRRNLNKIDNAINQLDVTKQSLTYLLLL